MNWLAKLYKAFQERRRIKTEQAVIALENKKRRILKQAETLDCTPFVLLLFQQGRIDGAEEFVSIVDRLVTEARDFGVEREVRRLISRGATVTAGKVLTLAAKKQRARSEIGQLR